MLVRANLIIQQVHFISSPANHSRPPAPLHNDQTATVEDHQPAESHSEQEAIPEMTAKSAIDKHGDYGTIIIHNDNQQDSSSSSHGVESAAETQCKIALESASDVTTDKMMAQHGMMSAASSTFSSLQPQTDNDSLHSDNLTSYHGILSKMPVSSLLLESPIPSCIGSIDFKENHSLLTDDDTVTPPANLVYYKKREDFYPQKIIEQQHQQEEGEIFPPALNHNRRQSLHMAFGRAVTKIYPKPASIHEGSGMPVFKPLGSYKKPKDIYRKIKT
ncbi:hypothetical protein FB192DRAFT_1453370, partial [Mucor lusitanicus]